MPAKIEFSPQSSSYDEQLAEYFAKLQEIKAATRKLQNQLKQQLWISEMTLTEQEVFLAEMIQILLHEHRAYEHNDELQALAEFLLSEEAVPRFREVLDSGIYFEPVIPFFVIAQWFSNTHEFQTSPETHISQQLTELYSIANGANFRPKQPVRKLAKPLPFAEHAKVVVAIYNLECIAEASNRWLASQRGNKPQPDAEIEP